MLAFLTSPIASVGATCECSLSDEAWRLLSQRYPQVVTVYDWIVHGEAIAFGDQLSGNNNDDDFDVGSESDPLNDTAVLEFSKQVCRLFAELAEVEWRPKFPEGTPILPIANVVFDALSATCYYEMLDDADGFFTAPYDLLAAYPMISKTFVPDTKRKIVTARMLHIRKLAASFGKAGVKELRLRKQADHLYDLAILAGMTAKEIKGILLK